MFLPEIENGFEGNSILTAVLRKNGYTVNHVDANTNNLTEDELYQIQ